MYGNIYISKRGVLGWKNIDGENGYAIRIQIEIRKSHNILK